MTHQEKGAKLKELILEFSALTVDTEKEIVLGKVAELNRLFYQYNTQNKGLYSEVDTEGSRILFGRANEVYENGQADPEKFAKLKHSIVDWMR